MIHLAIGDLRRNPLTAWLTLSGGERPAGLVGASYEPQASPESEVSESISLFLRGTAGVLDAALADLQSVLGRVNRYTQAGVGEPHYLRLMVNQDGRYYYSRLLEATLQPGAHSLSSYSSGALSVLLQVRRCNWFDGEEQALPLSNSLASRVSNGLTVGNTLDENSDNTFSIDAADLTSQLPAPLRLSFTNTTAGTALQDLLVGSFQHHPADSLPGFHLEGEDADSSGTVISSAGASGGALLRISWSAVGWQAVASWTLGTNEVSRWQGRVFLPVLRLAAAHAYPDLQMRLCLQNGGVSLWEGEASISPAGEGTLRFAPMCLPLAALGGFASGLPLVLSLSILKEESATYSVDVDDLLLIPQDGFARYEGFLGLDQADSLADDAFSGAYWGVMDGQETATHLRIGAAHTLQAGQAGRFVLLQVESSGLAPTSRSLSVQAWFRERKRIL